MSEHCPACEELLDMPERQNFCGHCGEPINADPDREFIRSNARGFLDGVTTKLVDTINGDRDHRSEYTRMQVQERARKALFDFALIDLWDGIENGDVLSIISRLDEGDSQSDDGDYEFKWRGFQSMITIVYATIGPHIMAAILESAVRREGNLDDDADVEVRILVDSEKVNRPLDELLDELGVGE